MVEYTNFVAQTADLGRVGFFIRLIYFFRVSIVSTAAALNITIYLLSL